jgi:hypothetical protein
MTGAVAEIPRSRPREPDEPPRRDYIGYLITAGIVACSVIAGVWTLEARIDDGLAQHDRQIGRLEADDTNLKARFDQFEHQRAEEQKVQSQRLDQISSSLAAMTPGLAALTTGLADLRHELRR